MDIFDKDTHRFSAEQTALARKLQKQVEDARAETEKTAVPQWVQNASAEDTVARINAFIKNTAGLKCYVVLQQKMYFLIDEIHSTPDGNFWHCFLSGDDVKKGTAVTIPKGGPLLLYIEV